MNIRETEESNGGHSVGYPPVLIILLFFLLFVAPLGVRPIILPDEARYAEVPREMIASGDWAVPRLNGFRYFEKPVMGYWLVAASIRLLGENEFAVRLPSAVATGISAFLLFLLVQAFVKEEWTPLVALAAFLTSAEVYWVGTFTLLDSALSLFVTGAMVLFFFGHMETGRKKRLLFLAGAGLCCGLAFLTKGFLGLVLPVLGVAPFALWEKRLRRTLRDSWIPALVALAVCLPWAIMIHGREPDFWRFFFWHEHIERFLSGISDHGQPFWFFFLVFPAAALPWTFLFPTAVAGLRRAGFKDPLIRFAICWLVFPFLFFSASSGKLPTYILPCFAPAAILLAIGIQAPFEKRRVRLFNGGALALAAMIALGGVLVVCFQFFGYELFEPYVKPIKLSIAAAGLFMWVLLILSSIWAKRGEKKVMLFAAAPMLFLFLSSFLLPEATLERKAPGGFLLRHAGKIHPDTVIVADEDTAAAVAWFYRRSDVYLAWPAGELTYGAGFEDSKHRVLQKGPFRQLIAEKVGKGRVVVIARTKAYSYLGKGLPRPLFEARSGESGYVFVQF